MNTGQCPHFHPVTPKQIIYHIYGLITNHVTYSVTVVECKTILSECAGGEAIAETLTYHPGLKDGVCGTQKRTPSL